MDWRKNPYPPYYGTLGPDYASYVPAYDNRMPMPTYGPQVPQYDNQVPAYPPNLVQYGSAPALAHGALNQPLNDPLTQFSHWTNPKHALKTLIVACRMGEGKDVKEALSKDTLKDVAAQIESLTKLREGSIHYKDVKEVYLWLRRNRSDIRNPYDRLKPGIDEYVARSSGRGTKYLDSFTAQSLERVADIVAEALIYADGRDYSHQKAKELAACRRETVAIIASGKVHRNPEHVHEGRCKQGKLRASSSRRGGSRGRQDSAFRGSVRDNDFGSHSRSRGRYEIRGSGHASRHASAARGMVCDPSSNPMNYTPANKAGPGVPIMNDFLAGFNVDG